MGSPSWQLTVVVLAICFLVLPKLQYRNASVQLFDEEVSLVRSMSKCKKAARKTQAKSLGDVTINDYANSAIVKHRPKKSSTNVTTVLKQLEDENVLKTWDDDDLDEYDYVKEENEDGEISYVLKKIKKTKLDTDAENETKETGKDYPVDIWFLISEYIKPEDIGRFAGICRTSYSVVNTGKFWISLYKRHYKYLPELPARLQPDCVFRLHGIRTIVIKSLFFMYPPFINKLKMIKSEEHPAVLTKRLCVLTWYQKVKTQWVYYFKFKDNICPMRNGYSNETRMSLIDILEDITANREENCRILQVTCLNFFPVPPLQGLFLTNVGVTLSQGFRHNRVQLTFHTNPMHGKQTSEGTHSIILDPVINLRVLDWWHPLYPQCYNIDIYLNQD